MASVRKLDAEEVAVLDIAGKHYDMNDPSPLTRRRIEGLMRPHAVVEGLNFVLRCKLLDQGKDEHGRVVLSLNDQGRALLTRDRRSSMSALKTRIDKAEHPVEKLRLGHLLELLRGEAEYGEIPVELKAAITAGSSSEPDEEQAPIRKLRAAAPATDEAEEPEDGDQTVDEVLKLAKSRPGAMAEAGRAVRTKPEDNRASSSRNPRRGASAAVPSSGKPPKPSRRR